MSTKFWTDIYSEFDDGDWVVHFVKGKGASTVDHHVYLDPEEVEMLKGCLP